MPHSLFHDLLPNMCLQFHINSNTKDFLLVQTRTQSVVRAMLREFWRLLTQTFRHSCTGWSGAV